MKPIKQLACLLSLVTVFSSSACSSGVESGLFSNYGLNKGDVIRVDITGPFENKQWEEDQKNKRAALDSGTTMQLSLVGYDYTGASITQLSAAWSTSDQNVVQIDNTGNLTAVSAGEASVTVTLNAKTGETISDIIDVTVLPSPVTTKKWTLSTTSLPQAIWDHASVIWNDYLYVAGGNSSCTTNTYTDCGFTDKVYFAPLDKTDSSVGRFTSTSSLPRYLRGHSLVAYNGYLYAIGGIVQPIFKEPPYPDPANFNTILNEVIYYAGVNPVDGSLGDWNIAAILPPPPSVAPEKAGLFAPSASVHNALLSDGSKKGYIYVTGGWSAELKKNVNRVLIGPINDDGTIEAWIQNDKSDLPYDLSKHTSAVASVNGNNYLYVIGGNSGSYGSQIFRHEILYAKIAEDGILTETEKNGINSVWHFSSGFLPKKSIDHATAVAGRYIFVLGGRDGVEGNDDKEPYSKYDDVISFNIYDTGDLQSLQTYDDLPIPLFHHAAVADINKSDNSIIIYVTGGAVGNTTYENNRKNSVYYLTDVK